MSLYWTGAGPALPLGRPVSEAAKLLLLNYSYVNIT